MPHNIEFIEGVHGSGVFFDGNDSYLDILDNPSLNLGESDFSISLWLEFSYLPDGYASILSKVEELRFPFAGITFFVGDLEGGEMAFRTSGDHPLFATTDNLNNGLWKHFVLVRREKNLEIYVDGKLVKTSSFPKTNVTNKGNLRIGCNYENPKSQRYNGGLDELRIYNRALSVSEINRLRGQESTGVAGYLIAAAILFTGMMIWFYNREKRMGLRFNLDSITSIGTGLKISFSLLYGLVCYILIFPLTSTFSDRAFFGGDTWEYQSMAVNFAKGHGIQKFGQLEGFHHYRFDRQDENLMTSFEVAAHEPYTTANDFYRTPAYPLFIGIIYKIFGVHPLIAKHIQLILLIIIASFLPWIGAFFWGRTGFWSGFVAGTLYISKYYGTADVILTEPLITFSIFLVIVAFINFNTRKIRFSSALLGLSLGISLLVKGSLIFLPFLLAAGMMWQAYRQKSFGVVKRLVIVGASMTVTILPWSTYASITAGHLIILSTQGEAVLLDGNNEFSEDGGWHPEWRHDDEHFYKREEISELPLPIRVLKFYSSHPELFPRIFKDKLINAFTPFLGVWIILLLVIIDYWSSKIYQFFNKPAYIIFMLVSLLALLMFITLPFVLGIAADKLFAFSTNNLKDSLVFHVVLLGTLTAVAIDRKTKLSIKFPFIVVIFFLNFLALTLITFGDRRFIQVIDFIFILCAVQYLILTIFSFYKKGSVAGRSIDQEKTVSIT